MHILNVVHKVYASLQYMHASLHYSARMHYYIHILNILTVRALLLVECSTPWCSAFSCLSTPAPEGLTPLLPKAAVSWDTFLSNSSSDPKLIHCNGD